ncbi:MAG: dihydrofolate reductase [Crocinitomicaceae bacterium]|nr:dihydrofolate reductase [Crocinitomicaceae bacterium]
MAKLIVAIASNRVIGKNNDLIWHLPADMKFFTETTKNNIVVMGRKNWNSIPDKYRPLPHRLNVVVSRDPEFSDEGCVVFGSVEDAIEAYKMDDRETYVIGGGQIYAYALKHNLVDEMLITTIHQDFDGDTFFPDFNEDNWEKQLLMSHPIDERNPHAFDVWRYTKK